MLRQLQGLACTHEEMPRECLPHTGKVGPLPYNLPVGQDLLFVKGELQFVQVVQIRQELILGRKKSFK